MAQSDAELAKRASQGDTTALEALYHRYVHRVWRFAWLRTNSRDEAADIVQETFLRVVRSVGQFRGDSSFTTWLFLVTRSVAIERARRAHRDRLINVEPGVIRLVTAELDTEATTLNQESRDAVRQALADLPGSQRDAIILYELSGLSIRDTARILDWSESRVKVTLFRARRALRDLLGSFVKQGTKTTNECS